MRLRWRAPVPPARGALADWMNSWQGLGVIVAGMPAQAYNASS
jgi:hypothetical protein